MWPFTLSLPNPDPVWKVLPSKKNWDFLKHCVWMDTKFRCNMISDVLSNYSLCKTSRTICAKVRNYVPIHLNHTQYSRTHCYSPSSICDFPIQRSATTSKQKQLTQEEWYARHHSFQASPLTNFRVMELLPRWPEPSFWAPNGCSLVGFWMVLCSEPFCNLWWIFEICLSVSNKLWPPGPRP